LGLLIQNLVALRRGHLSEIPVRAIVPHITHGPFIPFPQCANTFVSIGVDKLCNQIMAILALVGNAGLVIAKLRQGRTSLNQAAIR
jgi:hypothetical protein